MRRLRRIRRSAGGELAIEFDRRHPPRSADQLRENRRIVADPGADMPFDKGGAERVTRRDDLPEN
jgi:hypothetical protein